MNVEPTISLGNIISLSVTMGTVLIAALKISARLSKVEMKINLMWASYKRTHKLDDYED